MGDIMATYIVLANFTDQGIQNERDSVKRAGAVKKRGRKFGEDMHTIYWTLS